MGILHSKSRFFGCKTEEEEAAYNYLQQNDTVGLSRRLWSLICKLFGFLLGLVWRRKRGKKPPLLPVQNTEAAKPLLVEENSNEWRGSESTVDHVFEEIKLQRERDGNNVVLPIPSYKEVIPSSTVFVRKDAPTNVASALEKTKKSTSSASAVLVTKKDAPTSKAVVSMKITSSSQVQTDDERCKSSVDVLSYQQWQCRLKNNHIFTCPSPTSSTNVLRKDVAAGIIEGMHKKKKAHPEQDKKGLMSCCTPLSTVSVRKDGPINALVLEEMMRIKKADAEEEEKKKVKLSSRFIHEKKSGMKKKAEEDHHVVVSKERWIKHYSSSHRILLVGEGDFSFSASLALAFSPAASNIIATSLNPQAFLINNYFKAASNIGVLKTRHSKVIHEVDATKMATHPSLQHLQFDRIIFNFPYAGLANLKNLPRQSQLRSHRSLVSQFLMNAKEMINEDGEIHISHKTNGFHAEFKLESIAFSHKLRLIEAVDFNHLDYPGYNTKYGFGGDNNFDCYPSKTYKFALKSSSRLMF